MDDTEGNRRSIEKGFSWAERYGVQPGPLTDRYSPETKARLRDELERRFPLLARLLREADPSK